MSKQFDINSILTFFPLLVKIGKYSVTAIDFLRYFLI